MVDMMESMEMVDYQALHAKKKCNASPLLVLTIYLV
jgi:hypothetical protein